MWHNVFIFCVILIRVAVHISGLRLVYLVDAIPTEMCQRKNSKTCAIKRRLLIASCGPIWYNVEQRSSCKYGNICSWKINSRNLGSNWEGNFVTGKIWIFMFLGSQICCFFNLLATVQSMWTNEALTLFYLFIFHFSSPFQENNPKQDSRLRRTDVREMVDAHGLD